jgi:hypothetical protein
MGLLLEIAEQFKVPLPLLVIEHAAGNREIFDSLHTILGSLIGARAQLSLREADQS